MADDDTTPVGEEPSAPDPADASGADHVPFPEPTLDEHHYGDEQNPAIWITDSGLDES